DGREGQRVAGGEREREAGDCWGRPVAEHGPGSVAREAAAGDPGRWLDRLVEALVRGDRRGFDSLEVELDEVRALDREHAHTGDATPGALARAARAVGQGRRRDLDNHWFVAAILGDRDRPQARARVRTQARRWFDGEGLAVDADLPTRGPTGV